jgi:hypothetical protein
MIESGLLITTEGATKQSTFFEKKIQKIKIIDKYLLVYLKVFKRVGISPFYGIDFEQENGVG